MACFFNMCADTADKKAKRERVERFRRQMRYEELNDTKDNGGEEPVIYAKDEEIARLKRQNESLKRQLADIELEIERKKQRVDDLEHQITEIRDKYENEEEYEHKRSPEHEEELNALRNDKATLSQQIRKLDQILMETHQRSELFEIEIADLKQKRTTMMESAQRMEQEKDILNLETVSLKQTISDLENERNTLLQQLHELQTNDHGKEAQIHCTNQRVEALLHQQTESVQRLDAIKAVNESLNAKIAEKDEEMESMRESLSSMIAAQKATVSSLEQRVAELDKLTAKCNNQQHQIRTLSAERDVIQVQCSQNQEQMESDKERIDQLNRELIALQTKSTKQEEVAKEINEKNERQRIKIQELSIEIAALNATSKALQETLESTKTHLSKSGTQILSKEEANSSLKTTNESLQARNESLIEQLRGMETQSMTQKMESEAVNGLNTKLSRQIGDLNAEIASKTAAEQMMRQKWESAEDRLSQTLSAQQQSETELVALREQYETLRVRYDSIQSDHQKLKDGLEAFRNQQIEIQSKETIRWKEECESLKMNQMEFESKHRELVHEFEEYKEENGVNTVNQANVALNEENLRLKTEIASLKANNVDLMNHGEELKAQLSKSEVFQKQMAAQLGAKSVPFTDSKGHKSAFTQQVQLNGNLETEEEKVNSKRIQLNPTKKTKLNDTATQIRIALSEDAKARSMLLCCRPQSINKDGQRKDFGFLKFCQTHLSDKAVDQIFSKFKKQSIDATQLMSILTLTVIIYNVRLHQYQHGGSTKPKMDSNRIKKTVEHLTVYIVRKFGTKREEQEEVVVTGEDGEEIKGRYYGFNCTVTKKQFSKHVAEWIESYLEDEGVIDIDGGH